MAPLLLLFLSLKTARHGAHALGACQNHTHFGPQITPSGLLLRNCVRTRREFPLAFVACCCIFSHSASAINQNILSTHFRTKHKHESVCVHALACTSVHVCVCVCVHAHVRKTACFYVLAMPEDLNTCTLYPSKLNMEDLNTCTLYPSKLNMETVVEYGNRRNISLQPGRNISSHMYFQRWFNDTYPYRLASVVSKTELCLLTDGQMQ